MSREVKDLILEGVVGSAIRDRALAAGMKPVIVTGMEKVRDGVTTIDEVLAVAMDTA